MLVRALGLKEYTEVWRLQKELVDKRLRGEIPDTLLLLEHLPVYTRGVSSRAVPPCFLPHPYHTVERGGDLTYHGPGQLVGYPILHLGERNLRPRSYLRALEAVLIEAVRPLGLEAETLRGFTGVWCGGKKIASIGVAVKDQVSYHGFSLNVCCDLEGFHAINPCNLEADQIGTLQALLGRPLDSMRVMSVVAEAFLQYFGAPRPVAG
jgi:lipoyl(octanoyl) transferase